MLPTLLKALPLYSSSSWVLWDFSLFVGVFFLFCGFVFFKQIDVLKS